MERKIMVVDAWTLFSVVRFEDFISQTTVDYEAKILKNLQLMDREKAEKDSRFKQPIPYILLMDDNGKVFAYQRSEADEDYPEKRLQGKWSWGIGGHMKESDTQGSENPIQTTMMRELAEEVGINGNEFPFEMLGFLHTTSDEVSKVHIGILYRILIGALTVTPKDREIVKETCGMKSIEELKHICLDSDLEVEKWSRIVLERVFEV